MIKSILVALDPDSDTPAATEYAKRIGARNDANVLGLAIVDTDSIAASAKGGGIGSMYLADKVEAQLLDEARDVAKQLTESFLEQVGSMQGGTKAAQIIEGEPVGQLSREMNCQDLLIIGREPHFFYSHPEETSLTLQKAISGVISPVLVVPEGTPGEVSRILIAYDGSAESAKAMRSFLYLKPFGSSVAVDMINVHEAREDAASRLLLSQAQSYCKLHGIAANVYSLHGADFAQTILDAAARFNSQLLVTGTHFVTPLHKLLFGSTTSSLVANITLPMWVQS